MTDDEKFRWAIRFEKQCLMQSAERLKNLAEGKGTIDQRNIYMAIENMQRAGKWLEDLV